MSDPSGGPRPPGEDDRLLGQLRQALGGDPPPEGMRERVEGLLTYAELDRELAAVAELAELPPAAEPAGLRGAADPGGALLFESADGSVALELAVASGRIDGQLLAGTPHEVTLERLDGDAGTAPVDPLGRFSLAVPAAGPARLRLRGGARQVTTGWFLV